MRKYTYYKVKEEYDNKRTANGFIIANELLTAKEVEKHKISPICVERVQVLAASVYWMFGARFAE